MALYQVGECAGCGCRLTSREAHRIASDRKRRAGMQRRRLLGILKDSRSRRSVDQNQAGWLCSDCHAASGVQRQNQAVLIASIGVIGVIALAAGYFATGVPKPAPDASGPRPVVARNVPTTVTPSRSSQSVLYAAPSAAAERQNRQAASTRDPVIPAFSPNLADVGNVSRIQSRLSELGYLQEAADGRWGSKSRAALRAFRQINGLSDNDRWDELTASQLFGVNALRAPTTLPPASTR